MRVVVILLFCISLGCSPNTKVKKSPVQLTKEFIKDYKIWSIAANEMVWSDGEDNSRELYLKLIAKYCLSTKKIGNSIVVSTTHEHSPEHETVLKEEIQDKKAIVYTKFHNKEINLSRNYQYHYVYVDDKWFLEEVYVIEEGNKYPQL